MSIAGSSKELDQIMLLSSVPKLHEAIERLDHTLVRFSSLVESQLSELKTVVATNAGNNSRSAEALESIEAQLGTVSKNVARLVKHTREAVRERALDVPWEGPPERDTGRASRARDRSEAGGRRAAAPPPPPELEELYLAFLERGRG